MRKADGVVVGLRSLAPCTRNARPIQVLHITRTAPRDLPAAPIVFPEEKSGLYPLAESRQHLEVSIYEASLARGRSRTAARCRLHIGQGKSARRQRAGARQPTESSHGEAGGGKGLARQGRRRRR